MTSARIYVAKISGTASRQFSDEFLMLTDAIRWASALQPGDRADIYLNGALIWTKSSPAVADPEVIAAEAEALLTKLASDRTEMNDISFASYEGNPTILTFDEAWWCVDGTWHKLNSAEAVMNAALMPREAFTERFGTLPALPKSAFEGVDVFS